MIISAFEDISYTYIVFSLQLSIFEYNLHILIRSPYDLDKIVNKIGDS